MLIAITLDPLLESVTEVRHRIMHVLNEADVEPEQGQRVVLALSELVTNAILHGSGNPIRIEVLLDGDTIGLCVAQNSDGVALPDLAQWQLPDHKSQIGGRGLAIVALITDEIDVHADDERTEIRGQFVPRRSRPAEVPT